MKKYIMLFLFIATATQSFAQLSVGAITNFPFFNGSRLRDNSKINGSSTDDVGGLYFLNSGLFAHYSLQKHLGLQAEIRYRNEGFTYQSEQDTEAFGFNYIEIPALLLGELGKEKIHFFLQAGPSLKCLTSANRYGRSTEGGNHTRSSIKSQVNDFVLTANVGTGIRCDMKYLILLADLRFGFDITQIADSKNIVDSKSLETWRFDDVKLFQMALSIGVAYRIGWAKGSKL
ncbi:hypothetical protein AGMMS49965_05330 [Bacteroidia bacterium]|nr:hypothetical protein AGMMS49965_05330 [Bacteroidia bacterium]